MENTLHDVETKVNDVIKEIGKEYRMCRARNIVEGKPFAVDQSSTTNLWPDGFSDLPMQDVAVPHVYMDDRAGFKVFEVVFGLDILETAEKDGYKPRIGEARLTREGKFVTQGKFFGLTSFEECLEISKEITLSEANIEGRILEYVN